MIIFLRDCFGTYNDGGLCGDGCCFLNDWISCEFKKGEEIEENDYQYSVSELTEGEDYIII